jgi:NADPH:quinone reductase-like Zn-dependent oxidoreductase
MPDTMRAVPIHRFGDASELVLEHWPLPRPEDGEVLVRTHAVGINPIDFKMRTGHSRPVAIEKFPVVLGWDISGTVVESRDSAFKAGDEIFGLAKFPQFVGGYADYAACPAGDMALKPRSISHVEAAAVPLAALTAWQALFDTAKLATGDDILVHAAAGGVGHFAVQFARWAGAKVFGTASARNREFVLGLGAADVIDYATTDIADMLSGLDCVFDTLGVEVRPSSYKTLKKGGLLVTISMPGPTEEELQTAGMKASITRVHTDGGQMHEIAKLIEAGTVVPHVEKVFPLEDVADAHRHVETGHTRGKVVLRVADEG